MTVPDPIVRPYRPQTDFRAVLDAQCDLYQLNFPRFVCTPQFLAEQGARLRQAARRPYEHALFVLEDEGEVQGFVWTVIRMDLQGLFGSVDQVYLKPAYRGRGLGARLMEAAHRHLAEAGVAYVRLYVTESNRAAVSLYRRLGYDVIRLEMERPVRVDAARHERFGD
jgi:mycothiol synthase